MISTTSNEFFFESGWTPCHTCRRRRARVSPGTQLILNGIVESVVVRRSSSNDVYDIKHLDAMHIY